MVCPDLIGIGETISPTGVLTSTAIKKRVQVQPKFQEFCQSLEGNGKIDIGMKIYSDERYENILPNEIQKSAKTFEFSPAFYEIRVQEETIHEKLAEEIILTLEKCYATPTENPQDKVSYIILEDGYDYFSERSLLLFF